MATFEAYIKKKLDDIFINHLEPGEFFGCDKEKFNDIALKTKNLLIDCFSDDYYFQVIEDNSEMAPGNYNVILQLRHQEEPFNIIIKIKNHPENSIKIIKTFGRNREDLDEKTFGFKKDLSNSLIDIKEHLLAVLVEAKAKGD